MTKADNSWIVPLTGGANEVTLDQPTVERISSTIGVSPAQLDLAIKAVVRSAAAALSDTALDMRTNTWRLDVPTSLAKSVLCGAVSAVLLQVIGADAIPPTILALIAPFLFEIERVDVSASDVSFHASLAAAAGEEPVHLDDLYERLPESVRAELSVPAFGDVVDRLVSLRLAHVGPDGVRIEASDRHSGFRLLLR
jgi:hypothetical protein